jgi:hypothetical protein
MCPAEELYLSKNKRVPGAATYIAPKSIFAPKEAPEVVLMHTGYKSVTVSVIVQGVAVLCALQKSFTFPKTKEFQEPQRTLRPRAFSPLKKLQR